MRKPFWPLVRFRFDLFFIAVFAWSLFAIGLDSISFGQDRSQARNLGAPSPAEMLIRLQYRKQQETPLFDLLRNSGRDIFSKLGDDERKFAERFAEDLIQKRGLDSDEVQELMNQMNVTPEMQQAISESLKGADLSGLGSESPSKSKIDFDRLKRRLENLRQKQLLDQLAANPPRFGNPSDSNGASNFDWPSNANSGLNSNNETTRGQANGNSNNPLNQNGPLDQRPPFGQRNDQPLNSANPNAPPTSRENNSANGERAAKPNSAESNQRTNERSKPANRLRRLPRLGATPDIPGDFESQFPENGNVTERSVEDRPAGTGSASTQPSASGDSPLLDPSQRQIVDKLKQAIAPNSPSGRETRQGLEQLKQAKDPAEFLDRLQKLSKQVESDRRKQKLIEKAAEGLSESDEQIIQSFVKPFSPKLAESLRGSTTNPGQASPKPETTRDLNRRDRSESNPDRREMESTNPESSNPEDWAESEFLKKAISYYNDEASGFQKPKGFDRLLNDKVNRGGGSTMNFEAAKNLWKQGADIFNEPASDSSKANGIKPGQRIDQSVMEAIKRVSADNSDSSPDDKSMFTKALNGLIGTAMDKAEETAKDRRARRGELQRRNLNGGNGGASSRGSQDDDQSLTQTLQNIATNGTLTPPQQNSPASAAAPTLPTLPEVGSSIGPIVYSLIAIVLFAALLFFVVRMLKPVDEVKLKAKQLQQKLRSGVDAKPSDFIEAVDLLLLTKFGPASSWWNSYRAAEKLQTAKPGWHDKIGSVFQVYRWSRYRASSDSTIPDEQKLVVTDVLKQLANEPDTVFHDSSSQAAQASATNEVDTALSKTADSPVDHAEKANS